MASKEERERRRQERIAAEKREASAERRRLMIGYVVAGGLGLAVIVGLVIVLGGSGGDETEQVGGEDIPDAAHIQVQSGFVHDTKPDGREGTPPPPIEQGDLKAAASEAGCELKLDLPDEGNTHITKENQVPDYKTNPPTSGDHNPQQLADGAYSEMPEPWYFVHSMEHGRIEIQYSPDLPEEDQLALKGVFDEDPAGMLLFPNPDMPYDVATTTWTQLMGCESYEGRATLDAIRDFRDTYRGRGPEPVPIQLSG
ncbi:MAG: DUF3105 domain-containing protein [Solirubrobacterales bacterium]|nr:DUF3105 domain-containing protein [Solirubrobacterales bacterium]